jgi:hypothetical protein
MVAKDFFQDILPKDEPKPSFRGRIQGDEVEVPSDAAPETPHQELPERSIRNINVRRTRTIDRPSERVPSRNFSEGPGASSLNASPKKGLRASSWLWALAAVLAVALISLVLFVFRSTSVTIVPRAQTIVFDSSKTMTAYPATESPAGALAYTVRSFSIDESHQVPSTGSSHVERKASGSVTLVNEYSTAPVKLVKTTRFQTPDGLIFRAPSDISIPGMKGSVPGTVTITIVADAPGEKYNIPPTSRFTLPGLKGGAMYDKVYARSAAAFSGGFAGNEARVGDTEKRAAVTEMQSRLQEKVSEQLASSPSDTVVFPNFAVVTYEELPSTAAADGAVNLNLRAKVTVPVFPAEQFNQHLAASVSADAADAQITLVPRDAFGAQIANATSSTYGVEPFDFALSGTAQLVWKVDAGAVAQSLAGKNESAFQTIINGFPEVQEARARIEPFWRKNFPTDPASIQIIMAEPKGSVSP